MTTAEIEKDPPTFEELFENIINQAKCKYIGKRDEKGDSWQTCDIEYLEEQFTEHIKKYQDAIMPESKFKNVLDVINFALMLGERWYDEFYEEWRRTPIR